jgi:ribonucleoside-triphosphate reductase
MTLGQVVVSIVCFSLIKERRMSDNKTINVKQTIEEYMYQTDWRVKANANQSYSVGGMILNTVGKVVANYWLNEVYPKEAGEAHRSGDIHIHDLDFLGGYCCGHSLRALLQEGFAGVPGKTSATPPKHFSAALGQMANFLGTMQNEWAGAQAFSSFDTLLAPFVAYDKLDYKQVKQEIQEFIYCCGTSSRWGGQTVFSNITLDLKCPEDLKDKPVLIGGVDTGTTYKDYQEQMDIINMAFLDVMSAGDKDGRPFTFPIPTYNVTNDWEWDTPVANKLFEVTAKYGYPYFSNYMSSDMKPSDVRSMCCRLRLDLRELLKKGNGLFGSAEQTGSIGVVTLNMARLGYLHKGNFESLKQRVRELCTIAKDSLEIKRQFLTDRLEAGFYPFTKRWIGTYRNFFSTIGVNGMNEMILNYTDGLYDITTEYGQDMAEDILNFIRELMVEFQKETGHLYNLEATPAEGATTRFARADKKLFPDIIQAGTDEAPYYTNSSQIPVGYTSDIFTALDLQERLQTKYTGGTVLHLYMGQKISSGEACKQIVKRVLTNYSLPYISITPVYSICPKHGYIAGEHKYCPICAHEFEAQRLINENK